MTDPYEAPKSSMQAEELTNDPFEGVLSRVRTRSAGARWELAGMSFLLWLPIILVGYWVFEADLDENLALVKRAAFVACALVATRVISLLQTTTYLNHARGNPERPWNFSLAVRSSLYLVAPAIFGGILVGILNLTMGFAGVQRTPLVSALPFWSFLAPFVFVAPGLWAAAPFWIDGARLSDGWRQGQDLLKGNRLTALKPVLLSYTIAAAAVFLPPFLAIFDPVSKGAFAEAYLRR